MGRLILTTCKLGDDPPSVAVFSVQLPEARGCHRKNAKTHGAFLSTTWLGMAGMARKGTCVVQVVGPQNQVCIGWKNSFICRVITHPRRNNCRWRRRSLFLAAPGHIQPSDPTLLARDAVGKEFLTEVGKTDGFGSHMVAPPMNTAVDPLFPGQRRESCWEDWADGSSRAAGSQGQPAAANSMKRLDDKFEGCGSTGELYAAHAGAIALHPTTRRATSPTGNAHGKRVRFAPLFPGKWVGITCERWAPEPDRYNWGEITNSNICRVKSLTPGFHPFHFRPFIGDTSVRNLKWCSEGDGRSVLPVFFIRATKKKTWLLSIVICWFLNDGILYNLWFIIIPIYLGSI